MKRRIITSIHEARGAIPATAWENLILVLYRARREKSAHSRRRALCSYQKVILGRRPHMQCMACTLEHTMQALSLILYYKKSPSLALGMRGSIFQVEGDKITYLMNLFGLAIWG